MCPLVLKYPKKSHRKVINTPPDSIELAELLGVIFGDGGINNDWQLVISLNSVADLAYSQYVSQLITKLFNVWTAIRKRPDQDTLVIVCSSMNLLDFLISKGVVKGNKILQKIDAPDWIKANPEFKKAFVRGLVDTDGCLYTHKHLVRSKEYYNIGLCFCSHSKALLISVAKIFEEFGLKPRVAEKKHSIYLYSHKKVLQYLHIFGSSNPRIFEKYNQWRGVRVV